MAGWDYVSTLSLNTSGYDEQLNKAVESTKRFKQETQNTDNELKKLRQEGNGLQKTFQDFAEKMGMSKDSALKFGKELKDLTIIGGAFAAGLGAVKLGLDGAINAMKSTQAGAEEYNRIQSSLNETVDYFWESLAKGNISSFISNLDKVIAKASQARIAMMQLNNFNKFGQLQDESLRSRKAELEMRLQSGDVTSEELNAIAAELEDIANKLEKNADTRQQFAESALNKTLDAYLAKILTYEGIKEAGLSVEELKNEAKRIIREDAETASKWASMSEGEIVGKYRTLKTSTIQGGVMSGNTISTSEYSTDKSLLSRAALQYLFGELAASNNGDILGLFEQVQGKNDAGYNEARDTRNIIDKDIPAILKAIENGFSDTTKGIAENTKATDDKKFISMLLSANNKYTTQSGISLSFNPILNSINKLSDEQASIIKNVYTEFESSIANLEEQYSSKNLNSKEYQNRTEKLIQDVISAIYSISPSIAAVIGNKINSEYHYDGKTISEGLTEESDRVAQELYWLNYNPHKMSDEWLTSMADFSTNDAIVKELLSNMKILNGTGDGSMPVNNWELFGMDNKNLSEKYNYLIEAQEIFDESYERYKATFSGQDLKDIEDIYKHNSIQIKNALDIYSTALDAVEEKQRRLKESAALWNNIGGVVSQVGGIFNNLGTIVDGTAGQMLKFVGTTISGIGQMLPLIQQLIMAKQAEALAAGTAAGASAPFPTTLPAILGIIGIITSIFASLPRFDDGGIFEGKTSLGDFNLARVNNGEMILNNSQQARLFRMLNSGNPDHINNQFGEVTFKIQGTQLVGVLNNYNKQYNRFN